MTEKELIKWAAKLLDYLHEQGRRELEVECHEWFKEYWKLIDSEVKP